MTGKVKGMSRRPLPTAAEAAQILATRRTRPARQPPPPAGRQLGKFLKGLEEKFGPGAGPLTLRWKEIVGDVLARRTEPVKLVKQRGGGSVLELKVDGPAAALVQHQAPEILSRVNLFLGAGAVTKLRIVQGPVRAATAATGPAATARNRRRGNGPLDAALEAELARGLADAPDGALKASLMKLGRAVLRQS